MTNINFDEIWTELREKIFNKPKPLPDYVLKPVVVKAKKIKYKYKYPTPRFNTLHVLTNETAVKANSKHKIITTWYEYTHAIRSKRGGDIYTTQFTALWGAQSDFKEVYIDGNCVWPNIKCTITPKEIRYGHNLERLFAGRFSFHLPGEPW